MSDKPATEENEDDPPFVMLKPGWGGSFRRTIRDNNGEPICRLTFKEGEAAPIEDDHIASLYADIGVALVIAYRDEHGRFKPDWDGTMDVVNERDGTERVPEVAESIDPSDDDAADITALVDAGIDTETAKVLGEHAATEGLEWVLDPEAIKTKLAEGFDMTSLKHVGKGRLTTIQTALGLEA